MFILAYVDDFLLVGQPADIDRTVATLKKKWKMTDAGSAKWLLSMHIEHTPSMLALSQQAYIESLTDRYHLDSFRPISTPFEPNARLVPATSNDLRADVKKYQCSEPINFLSIGQRAWCKSWCYVVVDRIQ